MSNEVYYVDFSINKDIIVKNNHYLKKFLITRRINNIIYRFEDSLDSEYPIVKKINSNLSKLFDIPEDDYLIEYEFEIINFEKYLTKISFKRNQPSSFVDKIRKLFI